MDFVSTQEKGVRMKRRPAKVFEDLMVWQKTLHFFKYLGFKGNISTSGVNLLNSRFRGNDKISQVAVIPAKAGIQKSAIESSSPNLWKRYVLVMICKNRDVWVD